MIGSAPNIDLALTQALSKNPAENVKSQKIEKIEETAREFEAVFVSEMMKPMFAGLETAPPFGGGKGEEIFRSLLLQEYGKMIAQTDTIGIARKVKEEMIAMQEKADNGTDTNTSR